MIAPAGLSVCPKDMHEIVCQICGIWNIPKEAQSDFRRITLGAEPKDKEFFRKIATRGHYKQALTRILQQLPCP